MEVTRVSITDMPGSAWWEFLFQWGALMVQAAAAAATVAAVVLALNVARRDTAWRQDQQRREVTIVWGIVENALLALDAAMTSLLPVYENLSSDTSTTDDEQFIPIHVVETPSRLESCWKVSERLHVLPHEVGKELIFVMTNWPLLLGGLRLAIKAKQCRDPGLEELLSNLRVLQTQIYMYCNSIGIELRKFRGEPLMPHVPPLKSAAWQANC